MDNAMADIQADDMKRELLMGCCSPARTEWPREERPNTPARGSIQYLQALTQLANRLRRNTIWDIRA